MYQHQSIVLYTLLAMQLPANPQNHVVHILVKQIVLVTMLNLPCPNVHGLQPVDVLQSQIVD